MKRRNVDNAKLRRTLKKNKITEGLCGGSLIYLKLLLVWTLVMMADFVLELRFEYLWPFWMLLRSIYDSFRYQGVAFSVFFVCVTITSDMICFLFIPVQWLFFLASTYVWVQYVWHADRGICLPTVSLWLLYVYVEASVRLKELKSVPFTLDLCRPFAAHCIGYPVVTLGFGFKSYVSYRMRLRKQREVARVNDTYTRMLAESLPVEQRLDGDVEKHRYLTSQASSTEDVISNGATCNTQSHQSVYGGNQVSAYFTNHNNSTNSPSIARQATKNSNSASSILPKKTIAASHSAFSSGSYLTSANGSSNQHFGQPYVASNGGGGGTLDADEDDDEMGGETNTDWFSWISNLMKAKLFGWSYYGGSGSTSTPLSSTMMIDTSSSNTSSWFNNTWTSGSTMLGDSDDESRESKDSRDSSGAGGGGASSNGAGVLGKVGVECQLVKRFHSSSSNLVGAGGKQKAKRRGGGGGGSNVPNYGGSMISSSSASILSQQPQSLDNIAKDPTTPQPLSEHKEKVQDKDLHLSLESDIEKLKVDLRGSRAREQDLRSQVQQLTSTDKSVKNELQQLRQNNDQLQTRVQNLVRARQQDKQNMVTLEKKLAEEQKVKTQIEQQLQQERKQKKVDEASRNAAAAAAAAAMNKTDCTDSCKQRRREMDTQTKQLRYDLQQREEQIAPLENELRMLRQFKEQHNTDILMSALSVMQEKNVHLETSLSAETRVKLDLFSALGEAKRQVEIAQHQLAKKEHEADEMRRRLHERNGGDLYMGNSNAQLASVSNPATTASALTPPPPTLVDTAPMDLLGSAAYQTASYMTNLPGLMFDEHSMRSDYGAMSLMASAPQQQQSEASMRYSPPRSTSH